jgi:hypothetical protein
MLKATKPFSDKERDRWERTRAGGRKHYILVYGVLGWGLLTALLFSSMPLLFGKSFDWIRAALSLVLFPIGGIWWGSMVWKYMEDRYALGEQPVAD